MAAAGVRDFAPQLRALVLLAPSEGVGGAAGIRVPTQVLVLEARQVLEPTAIRDFYEQLGARPRELATVASGEGGLGAVCPRAATQAIGRFLADLDSPRSQPPRSRPPSERAEVARELDEEGPLGAALDAAVRDLLAAGRPVRLLGLGEVAEHATRATLKRHAEEDLEPVCGALHEAPNLVVALDLDQMLPGRAAGIEALRALREHMGEGAYLIYGRRRRRGGASQAELDERVREAGFEKLRTRLSAGGGLSISTALRPSEGLWVEDLDLQIA